MIKISDSALQAWSRYYYGANSVDYIIRHASTDINARILSSLDKKELLAALKESLSKRPENGYEVIAPFLITSALYFGKSTTLNEIENIDAKYTKWFQSFARGLFTISGHRDTFINSSVAPTISKIGSPDFARNSNSVIISSLIGSKK